MYVCDAWGAAFENRDRRIWGVIHGVARSKHAHCW